MMWLDAVETIDILIWVDIISFLSEENAAEMWDCNLNELNDEWIVELDVDEWEKKILKYEFLKEVWIDEFKSCDFSSAFMTEEKVNWQAKSNSYQ